MRSSPINHIRNNRDYVSSPYESKVRNQSPPRGPRQSPDRNPGFAVGDGGEYWRQRARQLETEVLGLNEELLFQARRNQKIDDLEEKIELLLAQNTHFVDQNENLIRLVQQKNSQIELWKKKFDSQYTHSSLAQAQKKKVFDHLNIKDQQHQFQIEKLLSEITRLQNEAVESDNMRKLQLHRIKNQYQSQAISQIQNLKRSQHGNTQLQELNIRKLKDTIEEKNYEIENLRREMKIKAEELRAQIAYNKNETKNLEGQKEHEISLIKAENENAKTNLQRAHRKKEDELHNLHETKVKRLTYEIEEKKNQIEENNARLKRTGKENESELVRLGNEIAGLRNETKENDNRYRERISDITNNYEKTLTQQRQVGQQRETNLSNFYEAEIMSLREVLNAKEAEIQRLLQINKELKENEQSRLRAIIDNNNELKAKLQEVIKHYEREVQLMKIKVSQLYEADLEALRSNMRENYATYTRETDNLRSLLSDTQGKLAKQVQEKLDLRKDYELRLTEFKVKEDKQNQMFHNMLALNEKQIENYTSNASLTHIEHQNLLQKGNLTMKQLINEKRTMEAQIKSKNEEIGKLNARIEKMFALHKRDIEKLQADLQSQKGGHQQWLNRQDKEARAWGDEKTELSRKNQKLALQLEDLRKQTDDQIQQMKRALEEKRLQIAELKGQIEEYVAKVGVLHSKFEVEKGNVEKTMIETRTLMTSEKEKLSETMKREKDLTQDEHSKVRGQLSRQIDELKHENEILQDNYRKAQIREQQLKNQIRSLLDSVNKRNKLQEHVINIGLSNNYFKNVAEIFKKTIDP